MDELQLYYLERGVRMSQVENKARELLRQHSSNLETSKPQIISEINEYAREEAEIRLNNVVIWDNGSIDIEFGTLI